MVQSSVPADIILLHGKMISVDESNSTHEAVAIRGENIQAVGKNSEISDLAGPHTHPIDLQGRTVIPGIIDIHAHLDREGLKGIYPSLEGAHSIPEILSVIKREVDSKEPGEWVVTMPIGDPPNYVDMPQSLQEGRWPSRRDLDEVSPNNPVYIKGIWTPWNVPPSVSIANSLALRMANIDRNTAAPDSSVIIERDELGEPTGIFIDGNRYPTVEFTLMRAVPRFSADQRVAALKESMKAYNSVGTTGIYEGHGVAPEVQRAYKTVWAAGDMTVRANLVYSPSWISLAEAEREIENWGHSLSGLGFGDSRLKHAGIYLQYGGDEYVARARSSELPFTGWAGFAESCNSDQEFLELALLAARHDIRVNTLVRGILDEVLDAFERVHLEVPIDQKRWVINHVLHTTPDQERRTRRLGLVVETIPLTELWLRGNSFLDDTRLANCAVAHRSYLEQGIHFGFGTDNKPYSPFVTFWSAVTRIERQTNTVLGPEQRLSRLEALRVLTIGGAYFSFEEDFRGSVEPGKLADMAVLSKDILTVPDEEIPTIESVMTLVGGEVVYRTDDV